MTDVSQFYGTDDMISALIKENDDLLRHLRIALGHADGSYRDGWIEACKIARSCRVCLEPTDSQLCDGCATRYPTIDRGGLR